MPKVNLKFFRGTYKECMAQATEDKKVYLAWDTQELFIGNKYGTKVKYGGSSNLKQELNIYFADFKNQIFDSVNNYAKNKVDIEAKKIDEKFSKLLEDINSELANAKTYVDSKISEIESTIDSKVSESITDSVKDQVKTEVDKSLEQFNKKLEKVDKNEIAISSINEKINEIEINTNEEFTLINNKVDNLTSDLQAFSDKMEDFDNKVTTTQESVTDLTSRIEVLENKKIPTKLSELENDTTFKTEDEINALIQASISEIDYSNIYNKSEIDGKLSIISGSKMNDLLQDLTSLNKYTLVFCNEDGYGFKYGSIYYVGNNRFNLISGGSTQPVEKTSVISVISLSSTSTRKYEISSGSADIVLTVKLSNGANGSAFSGDVSIRKNGASFSTITPPSDASGITSSDINDSISLQSQGTFSYTASATVKTEDDDNKYSITGNNSAISFSVYKPTLFGYGDYTTSPENYSKRENQNGEYNYNVIPINENVFLYTPNKVNSIKMSGFDYSFTDEGLTTIQVNGISTQYYKNNLGVISDNEAFIVVS